MRITFAMQPDGSEERLAQVMTAIGFTIKPHSQIGHSFTFRALGSRLVVAVPTNPMSIETKTRGVQVAAQQSEKPC